MLKPALRCALAAAAFLVLFAAAARAQTSASEYAYEPVIGMPGKDVVWVPTPPHVIGSWR